MKQYIHYGGVSLEITQQDEIDLSLKRTTVESLARKYGAIKAAIAPVVHPTAIAESSQTTVVAAKKEQFYRRVNLDKFCSAGDAIMIGDKHLNAEQRLIWTYLAMASLRLGYLSVDKLHWRSGLSLAMTKARFDRVLREIESCLVRDGDKLYIPGAENMIQASWGAGRRK